MDLRLTGKRALVTGASGGIGAAIATSLAGEGWRSSSTAAIARAEATAREIEAAGGRAVVAIGDLATDEGADAVAKAADEAVDGIDILVNNAGGGNTSAGNQWHETTIQEYLDTYNLNTLAGLRLIHRLVPAMVERGWGRVINISSAVSRQPMGMVHDYAAAKIALENLSLNLSLNLAPSGVTVNTVTPGLILTEPARHYIDELRDKHGWPADEAGAQARYIAEFSPQPVPRLGKAEEIASAVTFLASPLSDYTTSAVLRVDGGMTKAL